MSLGFIFENPPFPKSVVTCRIIVPRNGCAIDFSNPNGLILFHISLRPASESIVFNDVSAGAWGNETVVRDQKIPVDIPLDVLVSVVGSREVDVRIGALEPILISWRSDLNQVASVWASVPVEVITSERGSDVKKVDPEVSQSVENPVTSDIGYKSADMFAALALKLNEASDLVLQIGRSFGHGATMQEATLSIATDGVLPVPDVDVLPLKNDGTPAKADRRTVEEVGEARSLFQDDLSVSWGVWASHQSVKRHSGGCFELQQDKSTPGLRREPVDVFENCFYEFLLDGDFPIRTTKLYVSAYDPDNHIDLLPHKLISKNGAVHRVIFMTTSRTTRVQIRLLSEKPVIGEKATIRVAELKLLGAAESWKSGFEYRERICVSMASVKGRDEMVIDAVLSLYPFVDEVRVYLNGYDYVPPELKLPRVKTRLSKQWGDDGDAGKFFWAGENDCVLSLICDDDLIFPANYVQEMVAALKRYDNKAIVGVHGILLKQPTPNYYDGQFRNVCRYVHGNPRDYFVHVLGTGAIIYDRRELRLNRHDFQYRNMADIWLLQHSLAQDVPMVALARDRNWIIQNQVVGGVPTIYDSSISQNNDHFDTSKVQTAIVRQLWPITVPPSPATARIQRPKRAIGIIASDRGELEKCLMAFDRFAADDVIWSIVIGIPAKISVSIYAMLSKLSLRRELFFVDLFEDRPITVINAMVSLLVSIKVQSAIIVTDKIAPSRKGWETALIQEAAESNDDQKIEEFVALPSILFFPSIEAVAGQVYFRAQTITSVAADQTRSLEDLALGGSGVLVPTPRRNVEPRRLRSMRNRRTVHKMFDKVMVLNLDRRPDRLAAIGQQLDDLDISFERFQAIDGRDEPLMRQWLDYAEKPLAQTPEGVTPITRSRDFYCGDVSRLARTAFIEQKTGQKAIKTPGAWSYLRNYISMLEHALEREYESILVLDDDARFHRDFPRLFASMGEQMPSDWKIFQLGALQYDWDDDWITWRGRQLYNCNGSSVGSHATGIHWTAYAALLHQAQFMDLAFDIGALCHVKRVFARQCFTAYPNLVIQDTSESDIASSDVQQDAGMSGNNIYRWRLPDYREYGVSA